MAALLLAACSGRTMEEHAAPEFGVPPSIQSGRAELFETVHLTPEQESVLNVQTVTVQATQQEYQVLIPGTVYPSPEHFTQVSAPIAGRVAEIFAHEGERVRAGEPLLALESLEFANLAAGYLQARAEEQFHAREVERLRALVERQIAARSRLDRAEADLSLANASVRAARARLQVLGLTEGEMEAWLQNGEDRPLLTMFAPLSGVIDRHLIDLGESVMAYQELLTIVDTETVLVRGFLSPEDASLVAPGTIVRIRLREAPGEVVEARVATLSPSVDPDSRSVTINVPVHGAAGRLRLGQTVRLETSALQSEMSVVLPVAALQYEGNRPTVFVRHDPLTYEKRRVEIDRFFEDRVVITSGLRTGEEVAVTQVFSLKALSRYEQYAEE